MEVDTSLEATVAQFRESLSAAFDKLLDLSSPPAKAKGWTLLAEKHNVLATTRQTPVRDYICFWAML